MPRKTKEYLVTKQSLTDMLTKESKPGIRQHIIGRALVILYNSQTDEEVANKETKDHNGVGFGAYDANVGTRCAEYYIEHGELEEWMLNLWMKKTSRGIMITKYWRQLNDAAIRKKENK